MDMRGHTKVIAMTKFLQRLVVPRRETSGSHSARHTVGNNDGFMSAQNAGRFGELIQADPDPY